MIKYILAVCLCAIWSFCACELTLEWPTVSRPSNSSSSINHWLSRSCLPTSARRNPESGKLGVPNSGSRVLWIEPDWCMGVWVCVCMWNRVWCECLCVRVWFVLVSLNTYRMWNEISQRSAVEYEIIFHTCVSRWILWMHKYTITSIPSHAEVFIIFTCSLCQCFLLASWTCFPVAVTLVKQCLYIQLSTQCDIFSGLCQIRNQRTEIETREYEWQDAVFKSRHRTGECASLPGLRAIPMLPVRFTGLLLCCYDDSR
jgi:hypothetical protein